MKNKYTTIIFISIIIILVCGCLNKNIKKNKTKNDTENVVVSINNIQVYKNEALLYIKQFEKDIEKTMGDSDFWDMKIDGVSAREFAKEKTMKRIISSKIFYEKAKQQNLKLNVSELNYIDKMVKEFMNSEAKNIKPNVTEEIVKKWFVENKLVEKVKLNLTKDFIIDQARYKKDLAEDEEYQTLLLPAKDVLTQVKMNYIFFQTHTKISNSDQKDQYVPVSNNQQEYNKAKKALNDLKKGVSFTKVIDKYADPSNSFSSGEETISRMDLYNKGFPSEIEKIIYTMKVGTLSEIIETSKGYYIIKVVGKIEPSKEEISNFQKEITKRKKNIELDYKERQKYNYIYKIYDALEDDYIVKINDEIWNNIDIGI